MDIERLPHSDVSALRLNLALEPVAVAEKLSRQPQSTVLLNIYSSAKGGEEYSASWFLTNSLAELYFAHKENRVEPWNFDQILDGETNNTEEAEFLHLWNVRSALTLLAYRCLWTSNLPQDLQTLFSTRASVDDPHQPFRGDSAHLDPDEFAGARDTADEWYGKHKDLDIPLPFNDLLQQQIGKVCLRVNELVRFYDDNSGELLAFSPGEDPPYKNNVSVIERLQILRSLVWVLGPADDYSQLEDLHETFKGLTGEGWFNYREWSPEQRQAQREWRDRLRAYHAEDRGPY